MIFFLVKVFCCILRVWYYIGEVENKIFMMVYNLIQGENKYFNGYVRYVNVFF